MSLDRWGRFLSLNVDSRAYVSFPDNMWSAEAHSAGSRTFIAWYKGSQMNTCVNGQQGSCCGVSLFGHVKNNSVDGFSYLSIGLQGGRIAICGRTEVAKENPTGTILVADGEWHMLAWVYNGTKCMQMFYLWERLEIVLSRLKLSHKVSQSVCGRVAGPKLIRAA